MEQVENGILEIENILNSELSGFNHNFEVMEYIETNDHEAFDKAFDRLFTLYSESKDSYWLGQLGSFAYPWARSIRRENRRLHDRRKTNDFMACMLLKLALS